MTNVEKLTRDEKIILNRLILAQPDEGHAVLFFVWQVNRIRRPVFYPEGCEMKEENYVCSPYDKQKTVGILKDLQAREIVTCFDSLDREIPIKMKVCHRGYHTCELFWKRLGEFLMKSILTPILVAILTAFLTALLTLRIKYGL